MKENCYNLFADFSSRHRDVMYADQPDSKPISIIITTLSSS